MCINYFEQGNYYKRVRYKTNEILKIVQSK